MADKTKLITCADFKKNPDGTWTLLRELTVGKDTKYPGFTIKPGTMIGDIGFWVWLEGMC